MALPFDLPALSRGFADLGPAARASGAECAAAAARSLGALLLSEVSVRGRATPGAGPPRTPSVRLGIELAALPAMAAIEVEPALAARLVDVLAGGRGDVPGAVALTPVEGAALELFALAAIDGACTVPGIDDALAPRLARCSPEVPSALSVEIDVAAGPVRGRARLLLPPAAVRSLAGPPDLDGPGSAIPLPVSVRRGVAPLAAGDLDALAEGDVVVVDPLHGRDALVLAGSPLAAGRTDGESFHVEEITMTERHAQLPVALEIELARIEMTLAEIAALEPGAVVVLPVDRSGLVAIRAGERAIARGELVEVDGAIGVRILSLEVTA